MNCHAFSQIPPRAIIKVFSLSLHLSVSLMVVLGGRIELTGLEQSLKGKCLLPPSGVTWSGYLPVETLWLGKRRKSLKCLVGAVGLEPVWNFPCGRSQGPGKLDVQADPRPGLEGHRTAREAGIRHQAPHAWVDRTCSSVALDHHADPGAARLARFCVIYPPTFVRCYLIRYLSEVLAIPLMD